MNKIIIKKVTMKGFKDHKDEASYDLNVLFSSIYGDNAKGKTTIADAISWCLCASDYSGNEKVNSDLINTSSKVIQVCLTVDITTDKITETKEFKRIAGAGQSCDGFFIDGEKVPSQYVLNTLLNIDKNVFFSMVNPFYFSSLEKIDAKDTILKVVKKIEDIDVLNSLEPYQKEMLLNEGFKNNINLFMVQLKDDIKHMKEDSIYFQGTIDAKNEKITFPNIDIELVKKERENLHLQITEEDKTIKKEYAKEYKNQKIKEEKLQQLNNAKQHLAVLSSKSTSAEIIAIQNEMKQYKNYPLPKAPQLQNVVMLEKQRSALLTKYGLIKEKISKLEDIKVSCEKCTHITVLKNPERELLSEQLSEIVKEGKILAANITELTTANVKLNEDYAKSLKEAKEFITNELEKRQKQINVLNSKGENIEITKANAEVLQLQKSLEATENDLRNEVIERYKTIKQLESNLTEKLKIKQEKDQVIVNYNNLLSLEEKRKKDLEKNTNNLEKTKVDLINKENILSAAKVFMALKIKLQEAIFKKYLDKVDISLEKVVKSTGELKDDFSISYGGKKFKQISNSERIKAGLELVQMFSKLKDIYLPIIIDNAESITRYETVDNCQTIEMRVKKDSELYLVG